MSKRLKKSPYKQSSKRNSMLDIQTNAGRRAKHREAEQQAGTRLREAVGNLVDKKGRPLAGHIIANIAANRLISSPGQSASYDFEASVYLFLSSLSYFPNATVSVSLLWSTFLRLLEEANPNFAREIAGTYKIPFSWYVAGFVHRLRTEYDCRPEAIVTVEIWDDNGKLNHIGVQRDGNRRTIDLNNYPESPTMLRAGSELHMYFAGEDVEQMKQIGMKRFVKEIISRKRKLAPRPGGMLHEDNLVNVAMPTESDLAAVRHDIKKYFSLLK